MNEEDAWHRLHPLSPVVRGGRALIALTVVFVPRILAGHGIGGSFGDLGAAAVIVTLGVISWLVTRWRVEGGDLRIETGLIRRRSSRFPLRQIQAIDTVRPVLARVFGLSELRLRMGSTSGGGRLAYMQAHEAERLRARLLALAHGDEELPDASAEPAETVLVAVPAPRLIGSILLTRLGLTVEALCVIGIVTAFVAPSAATAVIGAGTAGIVGLLTAFWRRVNGEYNLTVAEASDGLRLRAGLLETTAETIPPGRVQAVRMIEPVLWRPFGWCRLEADIAGRQRKKGENQAQSRQLRAVLPVGSRDEAMRLLARIIVDAPAATLHAPPSARLKSPLRYRHLAWGHNAGCVVTTTGRITRTTAWVPLSKVQSLRRLQGPAQRRLGLATVHLDTAGRNIRAALRDRETAEADHALGELIDLCRAARQDLVHA